jgi:hypothetical protein
MVSRGRADLVHPLTVGPAPHILAARDDRTTPLADLARGVRFVVVRQGAVLVAHRVMLCRAAQVFQQPFFDLAPAEVRWGCHVRLPAGAKPLSAR